MNIPDDILGSIEHVANVLIDTLKANPEVKWLFLVGERDSFKHKLLAELESRMQADTSFYAFEIDCNRHPKEMQLEIASRDILRCLHQQIISFTNCLVPIISTQTTPVVFRIENALLDDEVEPQDYDQILATRVGYDIKNMNASLILDLVFGIDSVPKSNKDRREMDWADNKIEMENLWKAFSSPEDLLKD